MPLVAEIDTDDQIATGAPNKTAVALRYDKSIDSAPMVVATGRGYTADMIIAKAKQHSVPLRSDPALVSVLAGLNLGDSIHPDMYRAVAEVLVWVYNIEAQTGKRRD